MTPPSIMSTMDNRGSGSPTKNEKAGQPGSVNGIDGHLRVHAHTGGTLSAAAGERNRGSRSVARASSRNAHSRNLVIAGPTGETNALCGNLLPLAKRSRTGWRDLDSAEKIAHSLQ